MLESEILALYDEEVMRHPEGIKVADAKAAIAPAVRELIAATERDVERETFGALNAAVDPARDRRSRAIARDLEYILDYFANPDEAALIPDARMGWAIRLGTTDGADKALRYWRPEDFIYWAQVREAHAIEVSEAAKHAVDISERVVVRMRQSGARHFGDVDWATS